jgi:hypothetical protein
MTTEIETHPSETGGTTSITQSGRLPMQPAVSYVIRSYEWVRAGDCDLACF